MDAVKAAKLKDVQDRTYEDMLSQLRDHGRCNVVRPTGFGKTRLFMRYAEARAQAVPDAKLLYIYDTNSAKADIQAKYAPANVEFMSYHNISTSGGPAKTGGKTLIREILDAKYDTVIFDESHLMGGENIYRFSQAAIPLLLSSGVRVLGGTATQLRTDLMDVTQAFFDGHAVFEYTLEDAISDGVIENPYWTVMVMVSRILDNLKTKVVRNSFQMERLNQLERAYATRVGAPQIYRDGVAAVYPTVPDAMRFICFYPTIRSIKDNMESMARDFRKAFPTHEVRTFAISSDDEHYDDITSLEQDAAGVATPHIDLIFAVQMLNQAYHSDDLTGIVMNRSTISNIIFTQQLGRCLSVTSDRRAVVFDNVGNAWLDPRKAIEWTITGLNGGGTGGGRDYRLIKANVDPVVLGLLRWCARIRATNKLTQEQVDYARERVRKYGAPVAWASKVTGVPEWVINDEKPGDPINDDPAGDEPGEDQD